MMTRPMGGRAVRYAWPAVACSIAPTRGPPVSDERDRTHEKSHGGNRGQFIASGNACRSSRPRPAFSLKSPLSEIQTQSDGQTERSHSGVAVERTSSDLFMEFTSNGNSYSITARDRY